MVRYYILAVCLMLVAGCKSSNPELFPADRLIAAFEMGVICGVQAEDDLDSEDRLFFNHDLQHRALVVYKEILDANKQVDHIIVGDRISKMKTKIRFSDE